MTGAFASKRNICFKVFRYRIFDNFSATTFNYAYTLGVICVNEISANNICNCFIHNFYSAFAIILDSIIINCDS